MVLGTRLIDGKAELTRETFLCKVKFENGTPIYNPGHGKVLTEQERPDLPWTPVPKSALKDEFEADKLDLKWHTNRIPKTEYYQLNDGKLELKLLPTVVDSMKHASMLMQRISHHNYTATVCMDFKTRKTNEQAGLVLYRSSTNYYMLVKERSRVVLIKVFKGKKEEVAALPYAKNEITLQVKVAGMEMQFLLGETLSEMKEIGTRQNIEVLCEGNGNRFNGPGVGMYATSNGQKSKNSALYNWFEYKPSH